MRLKLALVALVATLVGVLVAAPVAPAATPTATTPGVTQAITATGPAASFVGSLTVTGVQVVNGTLMAVTTISGSITNTVTGITQTVTQQVLIPLQVSGSCTILHLTLGPLDLNLLGLMVHLNQVVLDITAQPGPGNLLGNLLCAVAHLLDAGSPLAGLTNLLNQILGQL